MTSLWKYSFFLKNIISRCNLHVTTSNLSNVTKPVRPTNSFGLFIIEKKNNFVQEINSKHTSFMRIAAAAWKKLDLSEKQYYADKAKQAMEAYKKSMDSLSAADKIKLKDEKKEKKLLQLKKQDIKIKVSAGRPKRPLSSYLLFIRDLFARNQAYKSRTTDVALWHGFKSQWDNLSIEEKEKYAETADLEKERYLKEMEQYVKTLRLQNREDLIPKKYKNMWLDTRAYTLEDLVNQY